MARRLTPVLDDSHRSWERCRSRDCLLASRHRTLTTVGLRLWQAPWRPAACTSHTRPLGRSSAAEGHDSLSGGYGACSVHLLHLYLHLHLHHGQPRRFEVKGRNLVRLFASPFSCSCARMRASRCRRRSSTQPARRWPLAIPKAFRIAARSFRFRILGLAQCESSSGEHAIHLHAADESVQAMYISVAKTPH
jgi:hypothetical protein